MILAARGQELGPRGHKDHARPPGAAGACRTYYREQETSPDPLGPEDGRLSLTRSWKWLGHYWGAGGGQQRPRGRRREIRVWQLRLAHGTYFICLTMVLFPDSPAPGTEGTGGQGAASAGLHRQATRGPPWLPPSCRLSSGASVGDKASPQESPCRYHARARQHAPGTAGRKEPRTLPQGSSPSSPHILSRQGAWAGAQCHTPASQARPKSTLSRWSPGLGRHTA